VRSQLLAGAVLVAILASFSPLWMHPYHSGGRDWGKELLDASAAREAMLRFHEPPVWNRYCGGGNPLLGNPETFCASPLFGLVLLFGASLGLKLSIVAHALLGAWGMARLVLATGGSRESAALGAALWPLTGYFSMHLSVGHVQWQTGLLLPFVVGPFVVERLRLWTAALALALMLLGGGVHMALIAILACLALAMGAAIRTRRWRPVGAAISVLLLGALLAGYRLVPSLSLLTYQPHEVDSHAGYSPRLMIQSLLTPVESCS